MARLVLNLASALGLLGLSGNANAEARPGAYIYAWTGDEDEKDSDFLAVIDSDPKSASYGKVVATAPIGVSAIMPHHIEYETPPGNRLFANGWKAGHSFILDVTDPLKPRLAAQFKKVGDFNYPHSFARLPNGNVLATFQSIGDKYAPPGALVELDDDGRLVRSALSRTPDIPTEINWPYSLAVAPAARRVVTTSTDMGMGPGWKSPQTNHLQIWSLDDLKLLASVPLPDSGKGNHHGYPAEPRIIPGGDVLVSTFNCGLYKVDGLDSRKPSAKFVHDFPTGPADHDMCAVPLVIGKYWIQTAGAINGLIVLDVSDPDKPREVSRLSLEHRFHVPHWIAADRSSNRIVVTGMHSGWIAMLKFDEASGKLELDQAFGSAGGIDFDRVEWPHGATGKAIVHGTVFSG